MLDNISYSYSYTSSHFIVLDFEQRHNRGRIRDARMVINERDGVYRFGRMGGNTSSLRKFDGVPHGDDDLHADLFRCRREHESVRDGDS